MSEWISVEDRLPEIETPVLAIARDMFDAPIVLALFMETCNPFVEPYFEDFAYWDNYHNDGADIQHDYVTHWMPLPEPPKSLNE